MNVAAIRSSRLTLGFLSPHNPHDRRAFSGTSFFAARALSRLPGVTVKILGPHRPPGLMDRIARRPSPKLTTGDFDLSGVDAVLGMVATPLLNITLDRHPDLPVLHVTDATPTFLREAYGWALPDGAEAAERNVAARASAVIYSSQEMAARAPRDLGLPGLQPLAFPLGVNFEHLPETCPAPQPMRRVNLLFVGLDWARKGGDIAVEALNRLLEQGIDARLTVVGRCPERHWAHPRITYAGFLSKNRARDAAMLSRLYREAHLLLLPSRSDCTPMVVAEAMAHGTPVVASDTGGIATLMGGGGTGRLLPQYASPGEWAATIRDLTGDPETYRFMADACFDRGRARLSWDAWAENVITFAKATAVARTA